jgi:flap endonuclease-1
MGIKNLLKFLSQYEGILKVIEDDNNYKYEKVAIDISIILYKVIIAIRNSGADLTNKKGEVVSHILGLFNKTIYLLKKNIIPIYVFDGKAPLLKAKILEERREIKKKAWEKLESLKDEKEKIKYFKRTASISHVQIKQCKDLLDVMGIPYIEAPEEADSQCAWLVKKGFASSVLTEDMDILTFGANKIYRNLGSYKKDTLEISLSNILEKLDLNYEQFIELCILFGCDYCDRVKDLTSNKIYSYYMENKDITKTLDMMKSNNINVPNIDNLNKIIEYFKTPPVKEIKDIINLKKPNIELLENILVNEYGLIKTKIISKISFLEKYYNTINSTINNPIY